MLNPFILQSIPFSFDLQKLNTSLSFYFSENGTLEIMVYYDMGYVWGFKWIGSNLEKNPLEYCTGNTLSLFTLTTRQKVIRQLLIFSTVLLP